MIRGFWNWLRGRCWVVMAIEDGIIKEVHVFYRYKKVLEEKRRIREIFGEGKFRMFSSWIWGRRYL